MDLGKVSFGQSEGRCVVLLYCLCEYLEGAAWGQDVPPNCRGLPFSPSDECLVEHNGAVSEVGLACRDGEQSV